MTTLILLLMAAALLLFLLDGKWQEGLIVTYVIGFLQDPLRKITPDQPSSMVGLVLLAFLMCTIVLKSQRQGYDLRSLFWTAPAGIEWLPFFFLMLLFQAGNSMLRFGNIELVLIGGMFYLAPLIGLWVGFQIGCNTSLMRKLIVTYLVMATIFAITTFLDFRGDKNPLFDEVGTGILIYVDSGAPVQGASGLWRTSEIASWHLAAAACFSVILALSSRKTSSQICLLLMTVSFAIISIPTGRRKAITLILAFLGLYLLVYGRTTGGARREKILTTVLGTMGLSYAMIALLGSEILGSGYGVFLDRAFTAKDDIGTRFSGQGLNAFQTAFQVAGLLGLGLGAGSNTGNLLKGFQRTNVQGLGYVSEGGGGRIVAELGLPGLVVIAGVAFYVLLVYYRNLAMIKLLPPEMGTLLTGMVVFGLANIPFFFSAAQLYNDPFVLIVLSLCFGCFFAVPSLVVGYQAYQRKYFDIPSIQAAQ